MDNSSVKNWTTKLQGCLLFDFPVAKFANHDPSANIAPGIDSDLPPASSPAPVPVPFPESSAPPGFEAFWLKKKGKHKVLAIYVMYQFSCNK